MADFPKWACWVDLETTGSGPEDVILEVGAILTRLEWPFREEATLSYLVDPPEGFPLEDVDPVVREMHNKNGLWKALRDAKSLLPVEAVDHVFADWLRSVTGSSQHVALGGSGVSHFDRPRFIDRDLPLTSKRLTYWCLDTGVLRRTLTAAGRSDLVGPPPEGKAHRGLADARQALDEFRRYVDVLRARPTGSDRPVKAPRRGW